MAKLIRDFIPEDMRSHGYEPELVTLSGPQRRTWLLKKLREESQEVYDSDGELSELADVYEVIRSLAEDSGLSIADVAAYAEDKAERRGRFENGYLWLDLDSNGCPNRRHAEQEYRKAEFNATLEEREARPQQCP